MTGRTTVSRARAVRAGVLALAVLISAPGVLGAGGDGNNPGAPPTSASNPSPATDWRALAAQTNQSLGAALDDAARGRPADARFRAARAGYDELLKHAPLSDADRARTLYNRGLADLALGDPGAAVFDLRRSDALAPGYAQTERELELARAKLQESESPHTDPNSVPAAPPKAASDREGPATLAWNAVRRIQSSVRWNVGLGAFVAAWLLLMPLLLTSSRPVRRWLGVAAVLALAVALVSIGTLIAEDRLRPRPPDVVVTSNDCTPRQGPDLLAYPAASFNGQPTIPRGTELRTLDVRTLPENPAAIAWVRVRARSAVNTDPGVWVRAADVGWVSPPSVPTARTATGPTAATAATTPAAQTPPRERPTPPPPAPPGARPASPAADGAMRT